jgi:hypothetical protein
MYFIEDDHALISEAKSLTIPVAEAVARILV